jgi:hypothetical protein
VNGVPAYLSAISFGAGSEPGRSTAFIVLLAFLASFLFIRTSARMIRAEVSWWPGNVETNSGLHLHHLVWGISLMLVSGFAAFALRTPATPWYQIAAAAFGVGAGLTFDEFALWVHLRDVYWSEQGRVSLDAVVLVIAFMGLVVVGTKPFGLEGKESALIAAVTIAQALLLSIITFLKGRILLGALSVFVPFLGLWGTLRLGRPDSPWARRRYTAHKLARARARFPADSAGRRMQDAFFNAVGGRPSEIPEPTTDTAPATPAARPPGAPRSR